MDKIIEQIRRARNTPLQQDSIVPFTEPIPGLTLTQLQDILDAVLAYGFPSDNQGAMTELHTPLKSTSFFSRDLMVALEGDTFLISVGSHRNAQRRRVAANGYVFWERSWLVEEVLHEIAVIDAKMRKLGFYDPVIDRRLGLFDTDLPIPVDHVFPDAHSYYRLLPETAVNDLISRFDHPDLLRVVELENHRILCHARDAEDMRREFSQPAQSDEPRSNRSSLN